jgi:carbonic anhydrase
MPTIDELVDNAQSYAETFDRGELPLPPAKRVAIVACMDARGPRRLRATRTARSSDSASKPRATVPSCGEPAG